MPFSAFFRAAGFFSLLWLLVIAAACLPTTTKSATSQAGGGGRSPSDQSEAAYEQGRLGLAAEKAGRFSEAAQIYERLLERFPAGEFAGEVRLRLVSVYLAAGDGPSAERLAGRLLAAETDPGRRAELGLARGRAEWLKGNFRGAAGSFLALLSQGGGGASRLEAARKGVLGSLVRLDYKNLAAIQQSSGTAFPGPEATYLLLYQTASAGHKDHAGALAEYFRRYYPENPLLPQVEAVVLALTAKAALPAPAFGADYDPRAEAVAALAATPLAGSVSGTVVGGAGLQLPAGGAALAVILPMSDKKGAGRFAQEVARGLELAVREAPFGQLTLIILDTGGAPDQAVRHLTQAAADPRVLAVVGPFLRDEARAASEAAGRADLPLIIISQATDLRLGPKVFRLFLTPRHQAEAMARHAVQAQNHQNLGVVYPDDFYGRSVFGAFQAEAARLGARVTVADHYSPKKPEFEEVAARLTGGQAARRVSTDYQAEVGSSVLYLPDSPGPVARFLPLLAFHDVTRMPFLGSSLWLDDPEFLAGSARYLQGAVIPAPLSELSQRPESLRFFDSFQEAYGHAPSQFAAYGYDAGLAIIQALGQGAASREALALALARGGQIPGVTGPFSFGQDGEYQVEPALLTIQERAFVLLREPGPSRP